MMHTTQKQREALQRFCSEMAMRGCRVMSVARKYRPHHQSRVIVPDIPNVNRMMLISPTPDGRVLITPYCSVLQYRNESVIANRVSDTTGVELIWSTELLPQHGSDGWLEYVPRSLRELYYAPVEESRIRARMDA